MTKKSPFPGMDPFMERHWEDVHTALIGYIRDTLQPQLSDDLIARMEETVYVEDESGETVRRPDVRVVEKPTWEEPETGAVATVVLDKPMLLEPAGDPIRQRSVMIYDIKGNRIVTAIEVLSPWNKKPGRGRSKYLKKRRKYLRAELNLVEIDLVRTGDWTRMIGDYAVPTKGRTPYRVTVAQPDLSGLWLYPISLRAKLPTIKVPLRTQDQPAKLNLQELIEKAYEMGRYYRMDYAESLVPPLRDPDKQWVDDLLRGRR